MVWDKLPHPPYWDGVFHPERRKDIELVAPFQFTLIGPGTKIAINVRDPLLLKEVLNAPLLRCFWVQCCWYPCPERNSFLHFPKFCGGGKWRLLMLLWGLWTPENFTSYKVSLFWWAGKTLLAQNFHLEAQIEEVSTMNSFLSSHHTFFSLS